MLAQFARKLTRLVDLEEMTESVDEVARACNRQEDVDVDIERRPRLAMVVERDGTAESMRYFA